MVEQLELFKNRHKPRFDDAQAGLLLVHLGNSMEPIKAEHLGAVLGWGRSESSKRRVRAIVEQLPQVVSINAGYLHIRNATNAHFSEYDGRLGSQIRKMQARRDRSRVEWNKYHRV